jgi:uncharacterized protein with NRDE domain
MCTVSFIPVPGGALICSNRDEKIQRARAIPPKWYQVNGSSLLFPKDPDAQGSWIAMKPNGQMAVLLNGGWVKHKPAYPYRKSRGLVFLEICSADQLLDGFEAVQLDKIEPFTVIIFQDGILHENRWDGVQKYSRQLPASDPHIWSSVTLYDPSTIEKRKSWFTNWLSENPEPNASSIQRFHEFGGEGDQENDLLMNRRNEMLTVSITCMEWNRDTACMYYTDLQSREQFECRLDAFSLSEISS